MRMYPYTGRTQYLRRTWRCSCRSCSTDRNGTVRYLWNPDEDVPNGTDQEVFKYYKMDVQGIKDRVKILISKKSK